MVGQHPSLYGTPDRIEAAQGRLGHPRLAPIWGHLLWTCQQDLRREPVLEVEGTVERANGDAVRDVAMSMERFSLAYLLSGETAYGRKAVDLMRRVCSTPYWIQPFHRMRHPEMDSDLATSAICRSIVASYDWIYPLLGPEDREGVFAALKREGAGRIYEDALKGVWWSQATNMNWSKHVFAGLGAAGVLMLEEDAELGGRWIDLTVQKTMETLDLYAEEGAGIEGVSYWFVMWRPVLAFTEALLQVTGRRLYDHPFWGKAVDFSMTLTMPDFSGWANYSDCRYPGVAHSDFFYLLASRCGSPLAQGFGDRLLDHTDPAEASHWNLLWYDPDIEGRYPCEQPRSRVFSSVHVASLRSDWGDEATFFVLKGGSSAWGHSHVDLGTFLLNACGERFAVDLGPTQYSNAYWRTVPPHRSTSWHNTLVVDSSDQRHAPRNYRTLPAEDGGDGYARIVDYALEDGADLLWMDLSAAYGDQLERFHRHVAFLKPDVFVIYDDIRTNEARAQRHLQWLLHTPHPIVETERGIEIQGEKGTLVVKVVRPVDFEYSVLERTEEVSALSLRPRWVERWTDKRPYPQWHEEGIAGQIPREYAFMVVLCLEWAGECRSLDVEYAQPEAQPDGVEVLRIRENDRVDTVWFNRERGMVQVGDLRSDARAGVVREHSGQVQNHALMNGTARWH